MTLIKIAICCTCLFFIFISCANQNSKTNNNSNSIKENREYYDIVFNAKINNIIIYSEDIEVETPFNIQCDNFLNAFSDIDSVSIDKPMDIDDFVNELKKANLSNNNSSTVDTRYLVKINYENAATEILCGDRFNIIFRNKIFKASPNIISKIYSYSNKSTDKNY